MTFFKTYFMLFKNIDDVFDSVKNYQILLSCQHSNNIVNVSVVSFKEIKKTSKLFGNTHTTLWQTE